MFSMDSKEELENSDERQKEQLEQQRSAQVLRDVAELLEDLGSQVEALLLGAQFASIVSVVSQTEQQIATVNAKANKQFMRLLDETSSSSCSSSSSSSSSSDEEAAKDKKLLDHKKKKFVAKAKPPKPTNESDDEDDDDDDDDDNNNNRLHKKGQQQPKYLKTKDEITVDDLAPLEKLDICLDKAISLAKLGEVISVVDNKLIVIKSDIKAEQLHQHQQQQQPHGTTQQNQQQQRRAAAAAAAAYSACPLAEETVLFDSNRKSLGKIYETFGPVTCPFYSLLFNNNEIRENGFDLAVGSCVYFAESTEYTKFIRNVDELRRLKGSDASWNNDNEPPVENLDYSDDEQEKEAKRQLKLARVANRGSSGPAGLVNKRSSTSAAAADDDNDNDDDHRDPDDGEVEAGDDNDDDDDDDEDNVNSRHHHQSGGQRQQHTYANSNKNNNTRGGGHGGGRGGRGGHFNNQNKRTIAGDFKRTMPYSNSTQALFPTPNAFYQQSATAMGPQHQQQPHHQHYQQQLFNNGGLRNNMHPHSFQQASNYGQQNHHNQQQQQQQFSPYAMNNGQQWGNQQVYQQQGPPGWSNMPPQTSPPAFYMNQQQYQPNQHMFACNTSQQFGQSYGQQAPPSPAYFNNQYQSSAHHIQPDAQQHFQQQPQRPAPYQQRQRPNNPACFGGPNENGRQQRPNASAGVNRSISTPAFSAVDGKGVTSTANEPELPPPIVDKRFIKNQANIVKKSF